MSDPRATPASTAEPAPGLAAGIALPAALSLIAGVTDVTSWLLLGGFFSAHVTGNLVVIAADVVAGRAPDIAAVLAIPIFILTAAAATVFARRLAERMTRRQGTTPSSSGSPARTITTVLLGSQALFLIAAAVLSFTTRASVDPKQPVAVVIGLCAVCAMAAQNAYLHLVPGRAPSTAVMTGNLVTGTVAGVDLLRSRGRSSSARARWTQTWPLVAGFVAGCLVGAAGATLFSDRAAVIPAALAVILFVVVCRRPLASVPTSTAPTDPRERSVL